jgi:hypothetical protein
MSAFRGNAPRIIDQITCRAWLMSLLIDPSHIPAEIKGSGLVLFEVSEHWQPLRLSGELQTPSPERRGIRRIRIFIRANNLLPVSATSPGAIASPGHNVPSSLDHVGRNLP